MIIDPEDPFYAIWMWLARLGRWMRAHRVWTTVFYACTVLVGILAYVRSDYAIDALMWLNVNVGVAAIGLYSLWGVD